MSFLVTARELGRERRYEPRPEALQSVTTWIGAIKAQWDQRVAALRSYLLDEQSTSATSGEEYEITTEQQERLNEHDSND